MSSDAITKRLRQTEQLRRLSLSLMKAKPISKEKAVKMRAKLRSDGAELASGLREMREPGA